VQLDLKIFTVTTVRYCFATNISLTTADANIPVEHTCTLCYRSSVGSRAFPIAGAKVWNSLPDDVTSAPSLSTFRCHLKTHLFRCCYSTVWYCSYLLWL